MSGHGRVTSTDRGYRRYAARYLGDWFAAPSTPSPAATSRVVHRVFTERHGAMPANQRLSFLCWVYRRSCVDYEGLRNPVAASRARVADRIDKLMGPDVPAARVQLPER